MHIMVTAFSEITISGANVGNTPPAITGIPKSSMLLNMSTDNGYISSSIDIAIRSGL